MVSAATGPLRSALIPLAEGERVDAALLDLARGSDFVLLGEATHGTREFYDERARITRLLIEELGFDSVAVEADWPDAYRANRYVLGRGDDAAPEQALDDFRRFPRWMWRNRSVTAFLAWLRDRNARMPQVRRCGFYGLDLYSLNSSIAAVIGYLRHVDPRAAERARERYRCFDVASDDPARYGHGVALGIREPCEDEAVAQLVELQQQAVAYLSRNGHLAEDEQFSAEQNARLALSAERYYRTMYRGREDSWNLRDEHMADTLDALRRHRVRRGGGRCVVWAHNSHLGDARATSMARRGEWNLGQLVRQRHGHRAAVIGFTTFSGTVTAAHDWGGDEHRRTVRPAAEGSVERLFHRLGEPRFLLPCRHLPSDTALHGALLERAIGVIYRPETEMASHYFRARVAEQFDAVIHVDETEAVEPLDPTPQWVRGETGETWPSGL